MRLTRATNPYSAGAGTMPPFLAGRDKNLETFAALLERLETREQCMPGELIGLETESEIFGARLKQERVQIVVCAHRAGWRYIHDDAGV